MRSTVHDWVALACSFQWFKRLVYFMRGLKCGKILFITEYIRVVLRGEVREGVTSAPLHLFVIALYFVAPGNNTCGVCVQAHDFIVFRRLMFHKLRSYMTFHMQ
jgi:hypothetical protein